MTSAQARLRFRPGGIGPVLRLDGQRLISVTLISERVGDSDSAMTGDAASSRPLGASARLVTVNGINQPPVKLQVVS